MRKSFRKGIFSVSLTERSHEDKHICFKLEAGFDSKAPASSYWLQSLMELLVEIDDYLLTQEEYRENGKLFGYNFRADEFIPELKVEELQGFQDKRKDKWAIEIDPIVEGNVFVVDGINAIQP